MNIQSVKDLAEGYFQITGRPISTMSVEEYKIFVSMVNTERILVEPSSPVYQKTESVISQKRNAEIEPPPFEESRLEDITYQTKNNNISKITKPIVSKTTTEQKQNNMLAILQSVSG